MKKVEKYFKYYYRSGKFCSLDDFSKKFNLMTFQLISFSKAVHLSSANDINKELSENIFFTINKKLLDYYEENFPDD